MIKDRKWEVLAKGAKITEENILDIVLANRGITEKKEKETFLHPLLEEVTAENLAIDKKNLTKALKRIEKAIDEKKKIVVFGDYDVDGITGTAILWETLHGIGANVIPYIPNRMDEGYGLSIAGIENILTKDTDTDLIITVDNGIVANEAVEFAKKKNIDVIITDHHTVGEKLPEAYAIVHTTRVCGAAVGWILSQEFISKIKNQISKIPDDHLALVALATVADLVPLTKENRTLLFFGLKLLKKTKRPGLLALYTEAKIEKETLDTYVIGHVIAPRLNAMGRLESAMDSLRILCTKDPKRAQGLADTLGATNRQRQELTMSSVEHAKQQVFALKEKSKLLFIESETYEEGIIGLIAGRMVEEFYLPTIVIAKRTEISKASARSIAGFNIIEAIRTSASLLINAGGHPMAAGFTIATEKIHLLKKELEEVAHKLIGEELLNRILKIDGELSLGIVKKSLYDVIQQLAPFGMGNPEPTFVSEVILSEIRPIGIGGKHLKLKVSPADNAPYTLDAIAFGLGERLNVLKKGSRVKIVFSLNENTWNGKTTLQLKIKDIHDNRL